MVLRQAIHDGPSVENWRLVCDSLDDLSASQPHKLEEMVQFADKYVSSWPTALRVAPIEWWLRSVEGHTDPRYRLVRSLVLAKHMVPAGLDVGAALADSAATRQLLHLSLAGLSLGDAAVERVVLSPRIAALMSLDLSSNHLGPRGFRAIAVSEHLLHLERLDLSDTAILPAELEIVLASNRLPRLSSLALRHNALDAVAAQVLAESEGLGKLSALDLSNNELDDRAAGILAASPYLSRLFRLDLRNNLIFVLGRRAFAASERAAAIAELVM